MKANTHMTPIMQVTTEAPTTTQTLKSTTERKPDKWILELRTSLASFMADLISKQARSTVVPRARQTTTPPPIAPFMLRQQ